MRKRITERPVRVHRDAVSGELVTTVLDAPQRAFERVRAAIDREAVRLSNGDAARLGELLAGHAAGMVPHTDNAALGEGG